MSNRLLLLTCSFCLFTCLIIAPAWGGSENLAHENYPPFYLPNGRKLNFGYPLPSMALHLTSLTPQQRQQIQSIYQSNRNEMADLEQQLYKLKKRRTFTVKSAQEDLAHASDNRQYLSKNAYYIRQLRKRSSKVRYQGWLATKALLTPQQLQELRQMALNSASSAKQ